LAKEIISLMCFINQYTEVIEYAAEHLLFFILADSMPGKYRKAFHCFQS